VPVLIKAGKALDEKKTEVRIVFKKAPPSVFGCFLPQIPNNQLIIRIQPQESIKLCIMSKTPAFNFDLTPVQLNLFYSDAFKTPLYDAYEYLLLEIIEGDQSLFISTTELQALWDIFVQILPLTDIGKIPMHHYPAFSEGPLEAKNIPERYGSKWAD
jgi:glucose-6-phosphate 1-dehydrogenase